MSWYQFTDAATFTTWHDQVCVAERIPYPGYNAATDELALDACWTTSYILPIVDNASGFLLIQLDDSDPYVKGLASAKAPEPVTVDAEPTTTAADFEIAKTLPRVWRDQTGTKPIPRTADNKAVTISP